MRPRKSIEEEISRLYNIDKLILEVLLDIRDQNETIMDYLKNISK